MVEGKLVEEEKILVSDIIVSLKNMSFSEVNDMFKESEILEN